MTGTTGTPPRAPVQNRTSVVGDGTTARSRARTRWRAARWPLAVLAVVVLGGVLASLLTPRTSQIPLAPDNPDDGGARAVAQILGDRGVEVHYVRTTADAVRRAAGPATVLVTSTHLVEAPQVQALLDTGADLVLVDPVWDVLDLTSDGTVEPAFTSQDAPRAASCPDPDATAAERIVSGGRG
ncbi:hypothetical protein N869_11560, partial [Cellulomonas bogoriensis 69B4 = DSM 16987]